MTRFENHPCVPVCNVIYLYGLDRNHRIVHYDRMWLTSIGALNYEASQLAYHFPTVVKVYAVDATPACSSYFRKSFRSTMHSQHVLFKDFLDHSGTLVWDADHDRVKEAY